MKTNILRALSERSFAYLWIGEIFTQIATQVLNFFLILIVFKETQSNTAVSGLVISFTIPAIIFGSIAGAYVDRWSKKSVLIVTNVLRGMLMLILIFYLHNVFVIYLISFLISILTQFFIPAETPMIPLVVQKKNLLAANALFGIVIYGSILVAYMISGPLIIFFKEVNTLIVLALGLGLGALFTAFITEKYTDTKEKLFGKKTVHILRDIQHTISIVSQTKAIYQSVLLLALSQSLVLIVATIAPGYATEILGIPVEEFPLLFVAPAALGMFVGAIAIANVFHSHSREKIIIAGLVLSGIVMLCLPYGSKVASRDFVHTLNAYLPHLLDITILHIMTVLAFILGFANALVFVPANTILQERTADEVRGKIYGFLNSIVGLFSLVPVIIVGGLSDLIGVGNVISGIGVSILLLGITRIILR